MPATTTSSSKSKKLPISKRAPVDGKRTLRRNGKIVPIQNSSEKEREKLFKSRKSCPNCKRFGTVEKSFGVRVTVKDRLDGSTYAKLIAQSYCKACR